MLPYVVGEGRYFTRYNDPYFINKERYKKSLENGRKKAKEVNSKRVKCLNDGLEFPSIKETAKHYELSAKTISISIKENREVCSKKTNKYYQFILCEQER